MPGTIRLCIVGREVEEELFGVVRVEQRVEIRSNVKAQRAEFLFFCTPVVLPTLPTGCQCRRVGLDLHDEVFDVQRAVVDRRDGEVGCRGYETQQDHHIRRGQRRQVV